MNEKLNTPAESGLRFFGSISGTISHELKNVLAIINENAGLLEDLALLAGRGTALDPERLISIATKVKNQVERGGGILKNLNQFSHSLDETFRAVELNETIELFLKLTERFAAMRGVAVKARYAPDPLQVRTAPFYLINLLWLCLDFALNAAGADNLVEITADKTAAGAQIRFGRLEKLTELAGGAHPAQLGAGLLDLLGAELLLDTANRELVVALASNRGVISCR
jgi:C4-dicarboxylate-specific signal transduction histidine kinase